MGKSTRNREIKQNSHQHVNKYAKFSRVAKPKQLKQDGTDKAKSAARNFENMFADKTLDERHYISFNHERSNYCGIVDNFEERKCGDYSYR